ncbi:MAG: polysaccharide pyruvyl transferase family protein [Candidatus Bathyarchaeia archaeon]
MRTRIFITGSCSTSFGNWEYQLGNAAILIGLLSSIHKFLPDALVTTKYQLSSEFCQKYGIQSVAVEPIKAGKTQRVLITILNVISSLAWRFANDFFRIDVKKFRSTDLLAAYYNADIIVDLSGDTYGDNIPFKNFVKHSLDLISASLLKKPIISLANSPGPFTGRIKKFIARATLNKFALITTREAVSSELLRNLNVSAPIITTACPAFLLEPAGDSRVKEIMKLENINEHVRPMIGFTLAGYNLYSAPTWGTPKTLEDLKLYIPTVKFLLDKIGAQVLLIPHVYRTNPWTGHPIQGPDYVILQALKNEISKESTAERLVLVQGIYSPHEIKGLIGRLDLYISGRLHAGVAALSQHVPTVLLAYGHKHVGFAKMLGQERYVWQPSMGQEGLLTIVKQIWEDREKVRTELHQRVQLIKELAELNAQILKDVVGLDEKARSRPPKAVLERWRSLGWEGRQLGRFAM